MLSFHGDPAVRADAIMRLRAHATAGDVQAAPTHWRDGKGSPAGCMVDDGRLGVWQQRLNIPKALGALLDTVASYAGSGEAAAQFALRWLETVPVAEDLSGVSHGVLIWLLADPERGLARLASGDVERQMIARIAELHRRGGSGDAPAVSAWGETRAAAMRVTDCLAGDLPKAVGRSLEAAAWDPAATGTVLSDTTRGWIDAHVQTALHAFGWTGEDDHAMQARLQGLFDEAKASGRAEETINVFDLLEQHHAAEAGRLRRRMAIERETPSNQAGALGAALIQLTRVAGGRRSGS